jgi:hypothetical protein
LYIDAGALNNNIDEQENRELDVDNDPLESMIIYYFIIQMQ